jgi:hypothetical protein
LNIERGFQLLVQGSFYNSGIININKSRIEVIGTSITGDFAIFYSGSITNISSSGKLKFSSTINSVLIEDASAGGIVPAAVINLNTGSFESRSPDTEIQGDIYGTIAWLTFWEDVTFSKNGTLTLSGITPTGLGSVMSTFKDLAITDNYTFNLNQTKGDLLGNLNLGVGCTMNFVNATNVELGFPSKSVIISGEMNRLNLDIA